MTLMKRTSGLFPSIPSFFDDFLTRDVWNWGDTDMVSRGESMPAVNIQENDNEFAVEVAAPGMKKEDFKIELDNNVLTISSEKEHKDEQKDEAGNYCRREFKYASFSRSFTLPEGKVNVDKINAKYTDGVLNIHLPKKDEVKPKPLRTINIG